MSTEDQNNKTKKCCTGLEYLTPGNVRNIPGLDSLIYRVGTHGSFKRSMQNGISSTPVLNDLTTRSDDDPTIAITDAWAAVLDILTFYQERIINEGYLGTARERMSVLELSKHIGYRLNPGVAAGTYLSFYLDEASGSPKEASIPAGTQIQSVPGQDEKPQIFETVEEFRAVKNWNNMRPRQFQTQDITTSIKSINLRGTATELRAGDIIMILDGSLKSPKRILKVTTDAELDTTRIDLDPNSPSFEYEYQSLPEGKLSDLEDMDELNSAAIDIIISKRWKEEVLSAIFKTRNWSPEELAESIKERLSSGSGSGNAVYAFRKQAFVFAYNAAKQITCNQDDGTFKSPAEWTEWEVLEKEGELFLDSAYREILPGSYLIIQKSGEAPESASVYSTSGVNITSRSKYGISSQTTKITLSPNDTWWGLGSEDFSSVRETTIYASSEPLELASAPVEDTVKGKTIILDGPYPELSAGRFLMISGERSDLEGIISSELIVIEEVTLKGGYTVIAAKDPLGHEYIRNTVSINGNVARATHGETKTEVLGSGDGTRKFQEFTLKQAPLTYVSASTPGGSVSTLEVRVNDVLWKEVQTLYGSLPGDRVYITHMADDGKVTIRFGDGITGARLPTGTENIKATYRVGIGLDGLLQPGQLSLLLTPPAGVSKVSNKLAPSGADDPEERDEAKDNAPLTVLSMDRIVSLQDYEDFTRSFSGIGKTVARLVWNGEEEMVHITVTSADGQPVDETSDLIANLISSIDKARHPNHQVGVSSFIKSFFDLKASVIIHDDYVSENVIADVKKELEDQFGFDARGFGQVVTPAEVISVIQGVEGVTAVDLDELNGLDPFSKEHFRLPSPMTSWDGEKVLPAGILVINPEGIRINEMKS